MSESDDLPEFIGHDLRKKQIYHALLKVIKPAKNGSGKPVKEIESETIEILKNEDFGDIPSYLIYRTLKDAGSSDESPIQSGGPWRGYFLESKTSEDEKKKPTSISEEDLYKLVREWMVVQKGFQNVRADLHSSKKNKEWGNPDIIALTPHSVLGRSSEIEVATAEVKLSTSSWRKWIFEAVSHTRFADRAYFIFRTDENSKVQDIEDLLFYAERFGVGLVQMPMSDELAGNLKKINKLSSDEFSREVADYVDAFVELFPAPSNRVPLSEKAKFLFNLGIDNEQKLWAFGNVS